MRTLITNIVNALIGFWLVTASAHATPADNIKEEGGFLFVFNQPEYAPGDTAFFTAYMLAGENQLPTKEQIVGIKLFGQTNEIIHHGRILFRDGIGISQIIISQNIKSGTYQFISYLETGLVTESPDFHIGYIKISTRGHLNKADVPSTYLRLNSSRITITMDRDKYERRSQVSVSIAATGLPNTSMMNLSMAVYHEPLFMDNADRQYGTVVPTVGLEMKNTKAGQPYTFPDFPSYFMGRAIIKSTGKVVPDSSKITFYLNESDFVYAVYTRDGTFSFPLFKNFGSQEVFYRITNNGKLIKDSQIILHDTSIDAESIQRGHFSDTLDAYGRFAKQKQFISRSYYYFVARDKKSRTGQLSVSDVETDTEILLEKYEPFPSMAEIFGNIIPSVRYKKVGEEDRVRVFLKETVKYGNHDPLYIVDGVMTDDTKYILSLDPKLVRRIGVLRSEETLARYGDLGLDGILVIETTELNNVEKLRHTGNSLSITGISKTLDYKNIVYTESQKNARVPDLRSCLYWNPGMDLTKASSFDFYTADDVGCYIIQIAGIFNGLPFLTTKKFYVIHGSD